MDIRVQELLKLEELIVLVPMDTLVDYGIICRTDISHKNDIGVNKYGSGAYSPIFCFRACFICKNLDISVIEICTTKDTVRQWSMINRQSHIFNNLLDGERHGLL